jgi:cysteine-rich repeat protein
MTRMLVAIGLVAMAGCGDDPAPNQPPFVQSLSFTTAEDTPLSITIAASDPDRDVVTVSLSAPAHGSLAGSNRTYVYTPAADFSGTESITATASDGQLTATAAITITVTPVNDGPTAGADAFATAEDTPLVTARTTLLRNDTDPDSDTLEVIAVSGASHGAVALVGSDVVFTPEADFNGLAGYQYTVSDGTDAATGTVTVTVGAGNDAPIATDDTATTPEDVPLVLSVAALIGNDSDGEGQTLAVTSVGAASGGDVTLVGETITFVPTLNQHGTARFDYAVSDGAASDTGTVVVTVTPVNDAPVAVVDTATTAEDVGLTLDPGALLDNDEDVDGDPLSVIAVGGAVGGEAALIEGQIHFTPAPDRVGPASFTYTVSDGTASAEGSVAVTVTPVNDAPVAIDDTATTDEDTAVEIAASTLVDNDEDVDGDALTLTGVGGAAGGTVTRSGGTVRFTPSPNFAGLASFTYTVSDGTLDDQGFVLVTVTPRNDAPTAVEDALTVAEDSTFTLAATFLSDNDIDIDGDPLTVTAVGPASRGSVELAGGTITFTPEANFHGAAAFDYTVSDGMASATGTVAVTVTPVNDPPVAAPDTRSTAEDTVLSFAAAGLVGNDTDIDGDALTVTAVAAGDHGSVELAGGTITFTPEADFHGDTSFGYTVSDGRATATATVAVTVTPVNDAPAAVADAVTATEDTPLVLAGAALTGNDQDVDGDILTITAVTPGSGGAVSVAGGVVTFTPAPDATGPAAFSYRVSDGTTTDVGAVTVTITPVNDAPVAVADAAITAEDTALVIATATLTANDQDVDGDPLVVTAITAAGGGTVELRGDGTIAFTPTPDTSGPAAFSYTVSDGTLTSTAAVAITVTPVNDAPVALDRAASTMEELPVSITLMATDAESDSLTFAIATPPAHGALSGDGATRLYTPEPGFTGIDTFTYTASDASDTSAPATVTIEVHANPLCGDGDLDAGEDCDDGNRADQDGCSRACENEVCGDGAVQYALGEQCDDDNAADGDGCSAACQLEGGYVSTTPRRVSGALGCGLESSHTGRKVAIDGVGIIYALLRCDGAAHVVVSTDRGLTFRPPLPVGLSGIAEAAIAAGAGGVVYVAAVADGEVRLVRSEDAGLTWSPPVAVATTADTEVSLEAWASDVYVGVGKTSAVEVLRSETRGRDWASTTVAIEQVFFDLLLDDRSGELLVCADSPAFHVRRSTDRGATFDTERNPGGSQSFSDWTAGNGEVLVAGASPNVIRLDPDLASSTTIGGLPLAASSQRAISADAEGNTYLVGRSPDGSIQLRRLLAGAPAIDGDREVAASGTFPAIASLPTGDGAAIVYMVGSEVYATVQVYE